MGTKEKNKEDYCPWWYNKEEKRKWAKIVKSIDKFFALRKKEEEKKVE